MFYERPRRWFITAAVLVYLLSIVAGILLDRHSLSSLLVYLISNVLFVFVLLAMHTHWLDTGLARLVVARWECVLVLLYTALFASAVTFVLLQYAALRLPAAKVMAYTYLTPSWVILWEIALGKPVPSGLVLVGVAMTVAALGMLVRE